jgi:hypothetical protein
VTHHLAVATRCFLIRDAVGVLLVALHEIAILLLALWVGAEELL